MAPYTLRTVCGPADDKVKEWLQKTAGTGPLFVVRHEADGDEGRPHWHALFWSDKTATNLRVQFTQKVPELKGNQSYSLKQLEEARMSEFKRYMCHASGKGDPVKIVAAQVQLDGKYSQAWADARNAEFYEAQDAYKKKKQKSKTPRQVAELACKETGTKTVGGITTRLIEAYMEADKPINIFHMRAEVRLIYCRQNGEKGKADVAREILDGINF